MAKKHVFYYDGKTGIAEIKGFKEKGLAELSCNIGNSCEFGCAFCYVPAIANKQKTFQQVIAKGYDVDDFTLYRAKVSMAEENLRYQDGVKIHQ